VLIERVAQCGQLATHPPHRRLQQLLRVLEIAATNR
jgi:hypothetical protein